MLVCQAHRVSHPLRICRQEDACIRIMGETGCVLRKNGPENGAISFTFRDDDDGDDGDE